MAESLFDQASAILADDFSPPPPAPQPAQPAGSLLDQAQSILDDNTPPPMQWQSSGADVAPIVKDVSPNASMAGYRPPEEFLTQPESDPSAMEQGVGMGLDAIAGAATPGFDPWGVRKTLTRNVMAGVANTSMSLTSLAARLIGQGDAADDLNRAKSTIEQGAKFAGKGEDTPEWVQRNVRGAVNSGGQMLLTAPMGPVGMIAGSSVLRGNEAITEAKDAGLTGVDAAAYAAKAAAIEGGITAIFQRIPGLGGLEAQLFAKQATQVGAKELLKKLGKTYAAEAMEEASITVADSVNKYVDGVDKTALNADVLGQNLVDTLIQTGLTVGLVGGAKHFADTNPERAAELAKKPSLSRTDTDAMGFGKLGRDERAQVLAALREPIQDNLDPGTLPPEWTQQGDDGTQTNVGPVEPEPFVAKPEESALEEDDVEIEGLADAANALKLQKMAIREEQADDNAAGGTTVDTPSDLDLDTEDPTATRVGYNQKDKPAWQQRQEVYDQLLVETPRSDPDPALIERVMRTRKPKQEQAYHPGNLPQQQVNTAPEPKGDQISNQKIADEIRRDLDVPLRAGRLQGKMAGVYKLQPEVIRTKKEYVGHLGVITHEAAHHIDKTREVVAKLPQALKDEVATLDYQPNKARPEEGFAEYMRLRLSGQNPSQKVPQFDAHFERILAKDADLKAKMEKWGGLLKRWQDQSPAERVRASRSNDGKSVTVRLGDKLDRAIFKVREAAEDRFIGFRKFSEEIKARRERAGLPELPKGMLPETIARVYGGRAGKLADTAIRDGVFSMSTGKKLSDGLAPTLEGIGKDNLEAFTDFIQARHSLDVIASGRNPGMLQQDAQALYDQHKDKAGWIEASNRVTAWNKALVKMLAETGGLSPQAEQAIVDAFPAYVPLKRAIDSQGPKGSGGGAVKHMSKEGSGAEVINPVAEMMRSAETFYRAATDMMLARSIASVAADTPGIGGFVEKVANDRSVSKATVDELSKQLEAAGADLSQADMSALIAIVRNAGAKPGGDTVVSFYDKGELQTYWVHPDIYDALANTPAQQGGAAFEAIAGFLSKPTKLVRAGAVGFRPSFALYMNPLRDIPTATIQTQGPAYQQPLRFLGSAMRILQSQIEAARGQQVSDPFVALARKYGAELSQEVGQDIGKAYKQAKDAVNDAAKRQKYGIALHWSDIQRFLSTLEGAPRLTEMRGILERKGYDAERLKRGDMPPMDVITEALLGYQQITTDFSQSGTVGRQWNRIEAFSNAAIQGIIQPVQRAKENPRRFGARAIAALTIPTLLYWWKNKDEDWYKEQEPWLRFGFWSFKLAGDKVLRIPKPFEIGSVFSSIPEAMFDSAYRKDSKRMEQVFRQIMPTPGTAVDAILPDAMQPMVEVVFNYSAFRDREIVGQDLEGLQPKDQFRKYNTSFSKWLGSYLNTSPAKLDHLLEQYTGGLGRDVARAAEGESLNERITKPTTRGESINEFYDKRKNLDQQYGSEKLKGEPSAATTTQRERSHDFAKVMTGLRNLARENPQYEDAYNKLITGLSRTATDKGDLKSYPNIFKDKSLPPGADAVRDKFLADIGEALVRSRPLKVSSQPEWRRQKDAAEEAVKGLGLSREEAIRAHKRKR